MIGTSFYLSFCDICGELIPKNIDQCDWCWYGMRMDPEYWKESLAERGIKVERGMGCESFGDGYICGNPYKLKSAAKPPPRGGRGKGG